MSPTKCAHHRRVSPLWDANSTTFAWANVCVGVEKAVKAPVTGSLEQQLRL